jgi:hypothetical protein
MNAELNGLEFKVGLRHEGKRVYGKFEEPVCVITSDILTFDFEILEGIEFLFLDAETVSEFFIDLDTAKLYEIPAGAGAGPGMGLKLLAHGYLEHRRIGKITEGPDLYFMDKKVDLIAQILDKSNPDRVEIIGYDFIMGDEITHLRPVYLDPRGFPRYDS